MAYPSSLAMAPLSQIPGRRLALVAALSNRSSTRSSGTLDAALLSLFRRKMAKEVGWNSEKPGYDGLIELSHHLMSKYKDKSDVQRATIRILRSLFPAFLLPMFRVLVAPLAKGRLAAVITARVTQATCQWLMGPCSINSIQLPDGTSIPSGVLVEKCKYLEESQCAGICIHTCKLPTQAFIKQDMGIPLSMEPNFEDLSCQFKFGVEAPTAENDPALRTPCLDMCPTAAARSRPVCPKVVGRLLSTVLDGNKIIMFFLQM